jgi:hypothetical protein
LLKKILNGLGALALVFGIGGVVSSADAARNPSKFKTCPNGEVIRSNLRCPTATVPAFSVVDTTVNENAGSVTIHITKSGGNGTGSSLSYTTANGTATAGSDYTATSGSITFSATDTDKTVSVPITNDTSVEGNETFSLNITAVSNATITRSGSVTIVDSQISPSLPLTGEATIADNFDVPAALMPTVETVPPSSDPVSAFRFTCLAGHILRDDPIVYPGSPGASHIHQFFGNTGTDANSTYTSLRTTGGSTCTRTTTTSVQRTAYWEPAMLDGIGNVVKPNFLLTYYKNFPSSDPACTGPPDATHLGWCIAIPNGLKFIFGYNMATGTGSPTDPNDRMYWAVAFECVTADLQTSLSGVQHSLADVASSGKCNVPGAILRVALGPPSCWDGSHVDTANHRDHMVYPNGAIIDNFAPACPVDHPYVIPSIALQTYFTIDSNFLAGLWHFSSDEMIPGFVVGPSSPIKAGYSFHGDYWEAWSPIVKNDWQTGCIDRHLSCNVGEMGNGQSIIGMQQVGPYPNHVLVPVSSIP